MTTVPTPPRRILIVDDDDTTRRGLVALMTGAGFIALPAATLQEATAVLERDAPDLIVTDIRLQGYNGLQILAMGSRPIPAIVVTGYPDRSIEADARKMGAEYLLKPISPASLLALVQQKLEASAPNAIFSATRRYARKPVRRQLKAWVQDLPVRILDISYGGLRLEIERTCCR
jgi:DNA-binding NtrC family response regulator